MRAREFNYIILYMQLLYTFFRKAYCFCLKKESFNY
jgi:hypothetical protein